MTRRLMVIGNGMAATRLVQRLVERDPARFAITVVGDEPHPAYNRIQLSPLLAGEKTAAQIPLLPAEWYTRHGVCLRSGEAVDEVDIQQRRLRIAETWLPWDELVFATGSRPFIPPLPGIDRPQVMPFRTLADVDGRDQPLQPRRAHSHDRQHVSSRAIASSGRLLPSTWLSKENRTASQVGGC